MNRIGKYLLPLMFVFCINTTAQMKKWILGSDMKNISASTNILRFWQVDLTGASPIISTRPIGNSINNIVSVGVNETINNYTDTSGNIIFYAFVNASAYNSGAGEKLYFVAFDNSTGNDEVFASISAGMGAFNCSVKNLNIVPRNGFSNQFYVIYKTTGTNIYGGSLNYAIVDMNSRTVSSPVILMSGSANERQAISAYNCAQSNRWLFFTKQNGTTTQLYRSSISSANISAPTLVTTMAQNGGIASLGQGEIEVSPLSDKLAYANFVTGVVTEDVFIWDLNLSNGTVSNQRYIDNPSDRIITIAFSPNGQRLYASRAGSMSYLNEIYNVPIPISGSYTIQATDKLNVTVKDAMGIEIGYDGNIYFIDNIANSTLHYITNPNANASSNVILQTPANTFGVGDSVTVALPDQIFDLANLSGLSVSITPSSTMICSGQTATLTASGGGSYQWSGGSAANSSVIIVSPASTSTYVVNATNGMCSSMDSVVIQVAITPTVSANGNQNICSGQSTTLTATGGSSYQWSGGSTATTPSIAVTPLTNTNYSVIVSNGNCSDTATLSVIVTPTPTLSITPISATVCIGHTATLTASGGNNYQWSGSSNAATAAINITPTVTSTYSVSSSNGTCSDTASITIPVVPFIAAQFTYSLTSCLPPTVLFSNLSPTNVLWEFGDGTTGTTDSPIHSYPNGTYTAWMITNASTACADTNAQNITVKYYDNPITPNIFTPNGDGINEELIFSGLDPCTEYELTVYNRWGQKIFVTNAPQTSFWNGTLNGKGADDGTYYYLLIPKDNKKLTIKGYVLVIR